MKKDKQKVLMRIKKIIIFICGGLILSLGTATLLYQTLGSFLNQLSEEEIKEFALHPYEEIIRNSINIYLITYILFNQFPDKVKKRIWYIKGAYFTFFYLFCYVVYIMI